jgi:hypothetical protein
MKVVEELAGGRPGSECGRNPDLMFVVKPKNAEVEQLMVQRAEGEAVIESVWPLERKPSDMRRIDASGGAGELAVVAAKRTLPVPRLDDGGTPTCVPTAPNLRRLIRRAEHGVWIETRSEQYIGRNGRREL